MFKNNPPTLREILTYRKSTDARNINVSKHNYKEPSKPKIIYEGNVDGIPKEILDLKIIAWLRNDGIYISE